MRCPHDDAALELAARRELMPAFRIEALLAQRPWSLAYLAREPEHDRPVVVKAIARRRLQGARLEDDLHRAAAAAAVLDHPHIIPTYRSGATTSFLWSSMKFVEGRTLEDILHGEGRLELGACLRLVDQVASALHHAHQRGAAHGGLTPGNVIVDAQGWAVVGDFAVSRVLEDPAWHSEYRAPESLHGGRPGPSADQYALAAIAYECLSGKKPFAGASIEEIARRTTEPPPSLSEVRPDIPTHIPEVLGRALRPDPAQRFPTVLDFAAALGGTPSLRLPLFAPLPRHGPGSPVIFMDEDAARRPIGRVLAVVGGLVVALGIGASWLAEGRPEPAIRAPSLQADVAPPDAPSAGAPTPAPEPAPVQRASLQPAPTASVPVSSVYSERPLPPPPPPPQPRSLSVEPARLLVDATPWGNVYIDGQLVGTTPLGGVLMSPGPHRVRVEREGFQPYERTIDLAPGQTMQLAAITLQAVPQ